MTTSPGYNKSVWPLVLIFALVTAFFILAKHPLQQWGVDTNMVIAGNILLFAVTLASLLLYQRAMVHPTTMGFLRNTYSGLFLKLLVCAIAVAVYILTDRTNVNKQGILICVFLYFIYTLLEMRSLMQWNKARRNA